MGGANNRSLISAHFCISAYFLTAETYKRMRLTTRVYGIRVLCTIINLQKKNPLMKHIRNVPWEVGNIIPDFELGKTTCALFLRYIICRQTI